MAKAEISEGARERGSVGAREYGASERAREGESVMIDIAEHYSMFTNSFVELNSVSVRA